MVYAMVKSEGHDIFAIRRIADADGAFDEKAARAIASLALSANDAVFLYNVAKMDVVVRRNCERSLADGAVYPPCCKRPACWVLRDGADGSVPVSARDVVYSEAEAQAMMTALREGAEAMLKGE